MKKLKTFIGKIRPKINNYITTLQLYSSYFFELLLLHKLLMDNWTNQEPLTLWPILPLYETYLNEPKRTKLECEYKENLTIFLPLLEITPSFLHPLPL